MSQAEPSNAAGASSPAARVPQWHVGHAVTTPSHSCSAYRHRYVVYTATPNSVAVVDLTQSPSSPSLSTEARWRASMRVCAMAAPAEEIAFVCGHPERDGVCVGTKQHGLYVATLSNPSFTEAAKLPRSVTGDATYGATFLFTEAANYLAFSSLLCSRPSDATPYRLSLWDLDAQALLWRGAMSPLQSLCGFPYDLSFAACNAGRVCLFTVQHNTASEEPQQQPPGPSPRAADAATAAGGRHGERNKLVVLSRHCSAVEELHGASYVCCVASPADGEDTYLGLTTAGCLVAFHASSGSVVRWMDCKVPHATSLCVFAGSDSLVLTGQLARLFQSSSWEFQGKIKLEPALPSAGVNDSDDANGTTASSSASADVFTAAVAAAGPDTLVLFSQSGAVSFHTVEPKAGTHRLSLHRSLLFTPPPFSVEALTAGPSAARLGDRAEWLVLSSSLWCWWTPERLLFVSAPGAMVVAAFAVPSACVAHHPASGTVVVFDTQRSALVAYGRATGTAAITEVAALPCEAEAEEIVSLASSLSGESMYALVSLPKSALPPRLRRYRCGWGVAKKGDVSEKTFCIDCMKSPDGSTTHHLNNNNSSNSNSSATVVASSAAAATTVSLPAGTRALVVHGSAGTSTEADRVVAVLRNSVVSIGLSGHKERASAPTYTHPDTIQRVLPCRGGLLVVGSGSGGAAAAAAFVQWKGTTSFRWAARPFLTLSSSISSEKGSKRGTAAATNAGAAATLVPHVSVVAAVATQRPDVAVFCAEGKLSLWQLGDTPRPLITTNIAATTGSTAVTQLTCEVEEATGRARVYAASSRGVDAYELILSEMTTSAALSPPVDRLSALSPPPAAAAAPPPSPQPRVPAAATSPSVTPTKKEEEKTGERRGNAAPPAASPVTPRTTTPPLPTRPTARTPRALASTAAAQPRTLSAARRQRRTASAGAPSSRQLSERFDELTGFYARQKRENDGNEHPRTPRLAASSGGHSRASPSPEGPSEPQPEEDEPQVYAASTQRDGETRRHDGLRTPPQPPASAPAVTASVIDVSALTVDSQLLRSAVAAANAANTVATHEDPVVASTNPALTASNEKGGAAASLPWSDSPPHRGEDGQRGSAAHTPPPPSSRHAPTEDAVRHSSASTFARSPAAPLSGSPDREPQMDVPQPTRPPQVHVRSSSPATPPQEKASTKPPGTVSDNDSMASEVFTVQARQLRASLLNMKELLEQSEMADASADRSLLTHSHQTYHGSSSGGAGAENAELDELASLLTTVAAQLHQRQVRRSAESA